MMKSQRLELIIKLVSENVVSTQEELQELLEKNGYRVTQATVSRDINELALIKTCTANGVYKYSVPTLTKNFIFDNAALNSLITDGVVSVDHAMNTVVVKCHIGMAQAVCARLDSLELENVVGTIAGDDTIFILMRTERDASRLLKELEMLIKH